VSEIYRDNKMKEMKERKRQRNLTLNYKQKCCLDKVKVEIN